MWSGRARLSGHVAVVTGAANGIGRAFAIRLEAEGAAVAVVDLADGTDVVAELTAGGGSAVALRADVSDPDQVADLPGQIAAALGPVDIVVNNAGIYPHAPFVEVSLADWRRMFAINVDSMFLTTQAFVPGMKERGWGRIVNMTSNSIGLVLADSTTYIATKMAVIGITRGLATELAGDGITVNAIAPSVVPTRGTADVPAEAFQAFAQLQAIKRVEQPDDLAGTVAFLASADAGFVTGQTLFVDGGLIRSS